MDGEAVGRRRIEPHPQAGILFGMARAGAFDCAAADFATKDAGKLLERRHAVSLLLAGDESK